MVLSGVAGWHCLRTMPGAQYRHRTAGLFPQERYCIHRTPDSIRRETVAFAEARATPRVSAAGPPRVKGVFSTCGKICLKRLMKSRTESQGYHSISQQIVFSGHMFQLEYHPQTGYTFKRHLNVRDKYGPFNNHTNQQVQDRCACGYRPVG